MWNSFRPDGGCAPLAFSEFDAEEAATVDQFIECIWANFGFNLDRAWDVVDTSGRKMVTMDEWLAGMKCIGFQGNAKLIFRGLGVFGLGRLWRNEFDYAEVLSNASMRQQHNAPPVRALTGWVQGHFANTQAFLDQVGFPSAKTGSSSLGFIKPDKVLEEEQGLSVSDLAARLTALGYPGDALQVSMIAAKTGGGTRILRGKFLGLLVNKRRGAPPMKGCEFRPSTMKRSKSTPAERSEAPWRPKKVWADSIDTISTGNDKKPACVRTYFGVTKGLSGFGIRESRDSNPHAMLVADATTTPRSARGEEVSGPKSARELQRPGRDVSPIVDTNNGNQSARNRSKSPARPDSKERLIEAGFLSSTTEEGHRFVFGQEKNGKQMSASAKNWNGRQEMMSENNARRSAYCRKYFSSCDDELVKKDIQRKMIEKHGAEKASKFTTSSDFSKERPQAFTNHYRLSQVPQAATFPRTFA